MNKTFYKTGFLSSSSNALKATAIEKELKMLEKAKERQKIQIQALIQHNLNKQHQIREIEIRSSPNKVKSREMKTGIINCNNFNKNFLKILFFNDEILTYYSSSEKNDKR